MKRRVSFAQTDMAGVMHFASYLEVMEEAEHAMWRSLNESVTMNVAGEEYHWPRARASCDYYRPVRFEDELDLQLNVVRIGEKSLTYQVVFCLGDEKVAVATATAVCCKVTNGNFASTAIPASIKEKLSTYLANEEESE